MKLKTCPFCGGEGACNKDSDRKGFQFYAFCSSCFCMTDYQSSQETAIKIWNERIDETGSEN